MAQGTLSFTTAVLLSHTLVNCGYLCVCDGRARHYNPRLESSGEGQGHRISADFLYEPFHFTVSEGPSAPEHFLFLVNPDPDPAVGLANLLHPLKLTSPSCIVISAWVSQKPLSDLQPPSSEAIPPGGSPRGSRPTAWCGDLATGSRMTWPRIRALKIRASRGRLGSKATCSLVL